MRSKNVIFALNSNQQIPHTNCSIKPIPSRVTVNFTVYVLRYSAMCILYSAMRGQYMPLA